MSLASRFNLAYLSAGIYCEEQLKPSDSSACLNSMLQQHWRARTEEQACQLMKEHVNRWRQIVELWDSLDLSDLDFLEQHKLRTEFFFVGTTRPFRSHAERRTWSEDFIKGWIRSNGKPADPATIAQQYLR